MRPNFYTIYVQLINLASISIRTFKTQYNCLIDFKLSLSVSTTQKMSIDLVQRRVSDEYSDSESIPYDIESSGDSTLLDDQNISPQLFECGMQTETNSKYMQTDTHHLPNANNKQLCTCELQSDYTPAIMYYNPPYRGMVQKQFDVKSCVLANTDEHTLVVPVLKRHVLQPHSNSHGAMNVTANISTLLGSCITNTLVQQNIMCQKLVYNRNLQETSHTAGEEQKADSTNPQPSSPQQPILSVPQVNFLGTPDESAEKEECQQADQLITKDIPSTSKESEADETLKAKKSPSGRRRKCNGWLFEGEPREVKSTLGSQVVTRRNYESITRRNETIHICDAVLLKSAVRKGVKEDYLARIAMFWEDMTVPSASRDMMMTIYWYYKPTEQTNFNLEETSDMEVLASRHRDDNSVACIMEKCYVLTFSQFCRFQAQKKLFRETGKVKQKVVPEEEDHSRFLPCPDVDESLVYFCRYGLDYRTGKLIK